MRYGSSIITIVTRSITSVVEFMRGNILSNATYRTFLPMINTIIVQYISVISNIYLIIANCTLLPMCSSIGFKSVIM